MRSLPFRGNLFIIQQPFSFVPALGDIFDVEVALVVKPIPEASPPGGGKSSSPAWQSGIEIPASFHFERFRIPLQAVRISLVQSALFRDSRVDGAYSRHRYCIWCQQKAYVLQIDFIRKIIAFDGVEADRLVSLPALGSECLLMPVWEMISNHAARQRLVAYVFLFFEGVAIVEE